LEEAGCRDRRTATEEKPPNAGYLLEKLALFISYFQYAVMHVESDHWRPSEWLESAGDNLMKVELSSQE